MPNLQVRVPDDLDASVDQLAKRLHGSRSDAVRYALAEGLASIRQKNALDSYVAGRTSLERAAKESGLPLHAMAARAAALGIPYFRITPDEADRDLGALR